SRGMDFVELGNLMIELGAYTAVNFDGGGSSAMYVRKLGGIVNHPADSVGERAVSNHLGIRFKDITSWDNLSIEKTAVTGTEVIEGTVVGITVSNPVIGLSYRWADTFIDSSTVALWRFDGKEFRRDKSLQRNSIAQLTSTQTIEAVSGHAMLFDGNSDAIVKTSANAQIMNLREFTFEAWVKLNDTVKPGVIISHPVWGMDVNVSTAGCLTAWVNTTSSTVTGVNVKLDYLKQEVFNYIVFTVGKDSMVLYVNGEKVSSAKVTGDLIALPERSKKCFTFGSEEKCVIPGDSSTVVTTNFFSGVLDEVKILNYAMDAQEVTRKMFSPRVRYSVGQGKAEWTPWVPAVCKPLHPGWDPYTPGVVYANLPPEMSNNVDVQFVIVDKLNREIISPVYNIK
ncbi:MAG: LamG-like jellyroll fold domain-containing protein, partial [Elusimicrobiota bacterium]